MGQFDVIVFGDKSLSDIFEEVYNNQKQAKKQLMSLIKELKPLIEDIGDATLIVPLIKEYMELSIKNDDILIKMLTIAQRVTQNSTSGEESALISDEEKEQLLAELDKLQAREEENNG